MSAPEAQSGEQPRLAAEDMNRSAENRVALQVLKFLGALALSAAITWAGAWLRDLGAEVARARVELVAAREAQASMIALARKLESSMDELRKLVDHVRLEQASRAGISHQIGRLEREVNETRARLRDVERRVSASEGRK